MALGSDHRRRSEIVLVKYEVKCLSVCLSVYLSLWLIIPAGAYGLDSDHMCKEEEEEEEEEEEVK